MARRPDGALERDVLRALWDGGSMTPREVRELLDTDLAYTTVMTVLTRLYEKRLVARERRGRAFAYRSCVSESELVGRRMRAELEASGDRSSALSGFVGALEAGDIRALRQLLAEDDA